MHKTIYVTVKEKIAAAPDTPVYICGNSDFTIDFSFDAEWDAYDSKTARFLLDNKTHVDVVFQGNRCSIPVLTDTAFIHVGVYAGNLCTTTPAVIRAKQSILCGGGTPAAPSDDVYNQIMEQLNMLNSDIGGAVEEYLKENPIEGTTFVPDNSLTLENGVLSVNTTNVVEADNTLPVTSAAVQTTVGNINILLSTI